MHIPTLLETSMNYLICLVYSINIYQPFPPFGFLTMILSKIQNGSVIFLACCKTHKYIKKINKYSITWHKNMVSTLLPGWINGVKITKV